MYCCPRSQKYDQKFKSNEYFKINRVIKSQGYFKQNLYFKIYFGKTTQVHQQANCNGKDVEKQKNVFIKRPIS